MKPGLVYAILIIVMVVAVTLFARSNNHVPGNPGTPLKSSGDEPIVQEAPTSKPEAGSDTETESGVKVVESSGRNVGDRN